MQPHIVILVYFDFDYAFVNSDDEQDEDSNNANSDGDSDNSELDKSQENVNDVEDTDFNAVTCLYPKEPSSNMIINHTKEKKTIKFKRKGNEIYNFAPGEGSIPTNWIREENHDVVAFPELFPDGKG